MKVMLPMNVYDAAIKRVEWCYDNYDEVVVCWSGGKDSTVVLNLAIEVARKRGKLPVTTFWLDQEAEWDSVVELARRVQQRPEVDFRWYQIPFRMAIGTAVADDSQYMRIWGEGEEWMRPREANSIHDNVYGKDLFYTLFKAIYAKDFADDGQKRVVALNGIRAAESFKRFTSLIKNLDANICYFSVLGEPFQSEYADLRLSPIIQMSPIYDWLVDDIWKSIHDNDWDYCRIYDKMYQVGYGRRSMRVSTLIAHGAVGHPDSWHIAEMEPELWARLTKRITSINDIRQYGEWTKELFYPRLPHSFRTWREYRDHLLEEMSQENDQDKFKSLFDQQDLQYENYPHLLQDLRQAQVLGLLKNNGGFVNSVMLESLVGLSQRLAVENRMRRELEEARTG